MRVIKIDAENKIVIEMEIEESDKLSKMQAVVGGLIEIAYELDNNDTVFVNEEGLFCDPKNFFEIKGGHQPFAGNGIVVGHNPKTGDSKSVESSLADIQARIKFLTIDEVRKKYDF